MLLMKPKSIYKRPVHILLIASLFVGIVLSAYLLVRNISQPWNGMGGGDGALFSIIAKNYLAFGVVELKGGQAINVAETTSPSQLAYYQHHPPLLPLIIAAAFSTAGESETTARLVPVILTIGSALMLSLIATKLYGAYTGAFTLFFFLTSPTVLFFGRKVGYEAPTLFFILAALWFYLRYLEHQRRSDIFVFFLMLGAGLLTDWPAYFLPPLLLINYLMMGRQRPLKRGLILSLPIYSIIIFLLFQAQSYLVDPDSFLDLLYQGMTYMGLIGADHPLAPYYREAQITFTAWEYTQRVLRNADSLLAYPMVLLSTLGFWFTWSDNSARRSIPLILLIIALANCIMFWRSVYFHPWWLHYFAAPFALFSALAVRAIWMGRWPPNCEENGTPTEISSAVVLFLLVLALVGSVPRVWQLHQKQERLLASNPMPQLLERADFIPSLGRTIRVHADKFDTVFTNLPGPATGRILDYYARKNVISIAADKTVGDSTFRSVAKNRSLCLLLWRHPRAPSSITLYKWVKREWPAGETFEVQGYQFELFCNNPSTG